MRLREETTSVLRGIHVVKFRLDKGLSLKKFAELVGYSSTGIALAEKESSKHISLRLENAIRKAFDLDDNDIQALLNGITKKRPPGIKSEYNPSWGGRLERVSSQSSSRTIIRRGYVDIIESGALDTAPDDGLSIPELKMLLDAVTPLLERRRAL